MILFFILFIVTKATFYSDSNYVLWSKAADNLICWGYYRARTYNFAGTFDNVPKLILTMEQYESTPNNLGVNFNLVSLYKNSNISIIIIRFYFRDVLQWSNIIYVWIPMDSNR